MNENKYDVQEPETFSTDKEPVKIPKKIVQIGPGFKDPIGIKGRIFQVNDAVYSVELVLKRMRRLIAFMGIGFYPDGSQAIHVKDAHPEYVDPLGERDFVFTFPAAEADEKRGIHEGDLIAYKVSNANGYDGKRTIKMMGKAVFD